MSFLSPFALPGLVVTTLAMLIIILPIVAIVVAVMPYITATMVALFRRDPGGVFVPHGAASASRGWALVCMIGTVLGLVAVQPRYFRSAQAVPAQAEGGDDLRAAIAIDLKASMDSLPSAGVVVGIVQPSGNEVLGFGRRSLSSDAPPDGETVYEIGGMTQVFTGLLFTRMVEKGIVRMDQPVQSLVPDTVSIPINNGQPIELQHLATRSSGLPRLGKAPTSPVLDLLPPFSRFGPPRTRRWLYDLLSSFIIAHPPGTHVDDSDLGTGLLGHALELVAKTDYDALLQREVCAPLGLRDTRVKLTSSMNSRLAVGMQMGVGSYGGWHVASPVHRWPKGTIPGAADLCSTANDLLILLRAHLAGFPLATALAQTRSAALRVEGQPDVGLGWFIEPTASGDSLVWQQGVAGTTHSYMAFIEGRGVGVVVLANGPVDVAFVGKRVLNRLLGPHV